MRYNCPRLCLKCLFGRMQLLLHLFVGPNQLSDGFDDGGWLLVLGGIQLLVDLPHEDFVFVDIFSHVARQLAQAVERFTSSCGIFRPGAKAQKTWIIAT